MPAFNLDYIPPAQARGNARGHWSKRATAIADLRESGFVHGLEYLNAGGSPIDPPYSVRIAATVRRRIDIDNLLIGYKPFIDGLQDARVIRDDVDILRLSIETERGKTERSTVTIETIKAQDKT